MVFTGNGAPPAPPSNVIFDQVLACVNEWKRDPQGPSKLIFPLSHLYTPQSLSFNTLKREDKGAGGALLDAAKQGEVVVYLGMLTGHEHSYDDGGIGYSRYGEIDYDDGIWEVSDRDISLKNVVDMDGKTLDAKLPISVELSGTLDGKGG